MYETDRTRRVAALLKRELAWIIPRELNDDRINGVTVTGVTVSRDLRQSTVYFSQIDSDLEPKVLEKLLNRSAGFLRHAVSQNMEMKTTPALVFKYDSSIERGVELSNLIDRLNRGNDER